MNDNVYPISKRFETRKATFYILFVDDFDKLARTLDDDLASSLDWAFCDNEWRFRRYLAQFHDILSKITYHVEVYPNCNWREFVSRVSKAHGYAVSETYYIEMDMDPFFDQPMYFNDELRDHYSESISGFDIFNDEFRYQLVDGKETVDSGYFVENEDIAVIRQMLHRVSDVYVFLNHIINTWYDDCPDGSYGEAWFSSFPESSKEKLRKLANFPYQLDDLQAYDLINQVYIFYLYVTIMKDNY